MESFLALVLFYAVFIGCNGFLLLRKNPTKTVNELAGQGFNQAISSMLMCILSFVTIAILVIANVTLAARGFLTGLSGSILDLLQNPIVILLEVVIVLLSGALAIYRLYRSGSFLILAVRQLSSALPSSSDPES